MLLPVQIVLTKLTNRKKKLGQNITFKLKITNCKKKGDCNECKSPFHLHTFPGPIKCKQLRDSWIKAVRQKPFDKKGSWQPAPSDQACSIHFVDGLATDENPIPTLFLGYESKEKKSRRTLF